jgi:hypothetical protein
LSSGGLLSGTPTTAGDFTFTITASNGQAPAATATYTLTAAAILAITGANIPAPLVFGGVLSMAAGITLILFSRLRRLLS